MHTRIPWQRSGARGKALVSGVKTDGHDIGPDGDPVAFVYYSDRTPELHRETIGNAEFIVKAVNNHDALVKALTEMVEAFEPFTSKPMGAPGSEARDRQQLQIAAHRNARFALTQGVRDHG